MRGQKRLQSTRISPLNRLKDRINVKGIEMIFLEFTRFLESS